MRIWSLHPKYLDAKGLVALWRETLLARHVLEGKTKGYINHPQLIRFKQVDHPVDAVDQYLAEVYREAERRDYRFDNKKINWQFRKQRIPVTDGQIAYEAVHLLNKLQHRDPERHRLYDKPEPFIPHPIFRLNRGEIADWEKIVQ